MDLSGLSKPTTRTSFIDVVTSIRIESGNINLEKCPSA